jgi:hypothetical protein
MLGRSRWSSNSDGRVALSTIVDKMETDYGKACAHLKATMKEWHFVHNLLDGTATEATVVKLGEMRTAYPNHKFGVVGRAGFEQRIFGLPESDIIALIGMAVSAEDTRNMRLEVVAELINRIMAGVEEAPLNPAQEPKPVPMDKLEFNKLPKHWCHTIRSQMANARLVEAYFGAHLEVERGTKVAELFRARYLALKEQRLPPGDIMTGSTKRSLVSAR